MRIQLKGIHKVKRRLADGSVRVHYYAWRGGPRIEGEPGTPEFIANYNEAVRERRSAPKNSLAAVVADYKKSPRHGNLAPKSRIDEARHLDAIMDEFGAAPIQAFDDKKMRRDVRHWHESLDGDRRADMALGVLRKVLDFARDDGLLSLNVAADHHLRYKANRADLIWSPEKLELICSVSSPELSRAILLSAYAGISRKDLCKLTWSQVSDNAIQFNRAKTDVLATVPIFHEIRAILDQTPKRSPQVLTNTFGRPWTPDGLGTAFDKAKRKAGITDLRFHDLRGTAVTFFFSQGLYQLALIETHWGFTSLANADSRWRTKEVRYGTACSWSSG